MAQPPELLPPHDHCAVCDTPVDVGEKYCCDACKEKEAAQQRKEKRNTYIFFGVAAAALVAVMVISLLLRK
jgi:predicted nucleic acid-binding Zn ribbon protein